MAAAEVASSLIAWVAAVPGVLAAAGVLVSHGRNTQRLNAVEKDVETAKALAEKVGRIDERTVATDKSVTEIKGDVARLVDHLLNEGRSFEPRAARRR